MDDNEIEHIDMSSLSDEQKALHHQGHVEHQAIENKSEYKKLSMVLGIILLISLLLVWARGWSLERFMSDFMAVFFITFASFKFANLEEFALTYRGYDVIAKRITLWAYAYPFVEVVLGIAYLLLDNSTGLNLLTMLVMGVGAVGVFKELAKKSDIMCACLGNVIRLPLSKVSLLEDAGMFAMAAAMLLL